MFPLMEITFLRERHFTIGVLSARTGVNIETIRYYERIGVMPSPPRTAGRQRMYEEDHFKRLTFIRRARELGFSIQEIRALLGLERGQRLTCADVKALTEQHIAAMQGKIADLKRLQHVLRRLAAQCHGTTVPDCPILDALAVNGASKNPPARTSER